MRFISLAFITLISSVVCQTCLLQEVSAQQSIVPTKNFSLSTTTIRNSDGDDVLGLSLNGNTAQVPVANMTVEQALALRDAQSQAALATRNATSSDDQTVVGQIISNNIVSQEASRLVQGVQTSSETQANISDGLNTLEQPQLNVGQIEPILSSADLDFERELLDIPLSTTTSSVSPSAVPSTDFGSGLSSGTSGSTGANIGGSNAVSLDGGQASSAFQSTSSNATRGSGTGRKQVYKYSKANKRKMRPATPSYVHTPYESTF